MKLTIPLPIEKVHLRPGESIIIETEGGDRVFVEANKLREETIVRLESGDENRSYSMDSGVMVETTYDE